MSGQSVLIGQTFVCTLQGCTNQFSSLALVLIRMCRQACLAFMPLQDREKPGHKVEVDEEYEDAEGNVYNRKTYEDLRRQGLI